jgi:hypothetical protein
MAPLPAFLATYERPLFFRLRYSLPAARLELLPASYAEKLFSVGKAYAL